MLNTYKVVMYMQRSYCFCNIHTPDKGLISGKKCEGTQWEIYSPIPAGYLKIDAATQKDKYKDVKTKDFYIVSSCVCVCVCVCVYISLSLSLYIYIYIYIFYFIWWMRISIYILDNECINKLYFK